MAEYPLTTLYGNLCDDKFADRKYCIVFGINASSFKLGGIAGQIKDTYNYANVFEGRRQLYNLNRAIQCDRGIVGDIVTKPPPTDTENRPHIIGMITQFGAGDSMEYNPTAKYSIENSRDVTYVEGLKLDTNLKRVENFRHCMEKAVEYVIEKQTIDNVLLPSGIGKRGMVNEEWNTKYLPIIKDCAYKLISRGIKVSIVYMQDEKEKKYKLEEAKEVESAQRWGIGEGWENGDDEKTASHIHSSLKFKRLYM